jgi:hypothetical protein
MIKLILLFLAFYGTYALSKATFGNCHNFSNCWYHDQSHISFKRSFLYTPVLPTFSQLNQINQIQLDVLLSNQFQYHNALHVTIGGDMELKYTIYEKL